MRTINDIAKAALSAATANGTKRVAQIHMKWWQRFCRDMGIDIDRFAEAPLEADQARRVTQETDTLALFAVYVVTKGGQARTEQGYNSVNYAEQIISSIRSYYEAEHGRRPGVDQKGLSGYKLKRALRGLRRLFPKEAAVKKPLLQYHLRAIREVMDLRGNGLHRALWALWTCQWQGVMRTCDLIKKTADGNKPWDPRRETHRGRVAVDRARDDYGRTIGVRLILTLKPNKTNQSGEEVQTKSFMIDENPGAISAGKALKDMISGDDHRGDPAQTPLFRDPRTGRELTYELSRKWLSIMAERAGFKDIGQHTHSLRIGGATAYANSPSGGELCASMMGLWRSAARNRYLHAGEQWMERAGTAIGRETGQTMAGRPGPVAGYSGRR